MELYQLTLLFVLVFIASIFAFNVWQRRKRFTQLKSITQVRRGTSSERKLILQLLKQGHPEKAIFHDLYINTGKDKYSQIDIVIATTVGIIVIEVKNHSGWIFGNNYHQNWTQVLAYGKKKFKFYNPIKQNHSHIRALQNQLRQFQNIPFYSIIAFTGNCELKEINYVPKDTYVVKANRLHEAIRLIKINNKPATYSSKREVFDFLKNASRRGESNELQATHNQNVKDLLGKDRILG
tara:strand:- start:112 stop:822 length:711 start_codon:yes stop_codon:yes gene_type:complete